MYEVNFRICMTICYMMWVGVDILVIAQNIYLEPIAIDVDKFNSVFTTNEQFLSLGMDSNLIRNHWETFNFSSVRLLTLARGLSGAYLRLSGTDGDRMIFEPPNIYKYQEQDVQKLPTPLTTLFPPTNFTFTAEDWDAINLFAAKVGWRIVFGLNGQLRDGSRWDVNNTNLLFQYSVKRGYDKNLDFELGNEPDLYFIEKYFKFISGKQLAHDYNFLHKFLRTNFDKYFEQTKLYGPSISNGLPLSLSRLFMLDFLDNLDKGVLDGITWHHYYGGSEIKYVSNYTDPNLLDTYISKCNAITSVVHVSKKPHLKIWQGETSSTYAPPGNNIDETFVAGFMLIDKLGQSAVCGMDVVIRQTFYGFWFALVNKQINPTPNYWLALLYKRVVGNKVLTVKMNISHKTEKSIRMFANCIASNSQMHKSSPKGVVLYGMNLLDEKVTLNLTPIGKEIEEFVFTPGSGQLTSTYIKLNGQILSMVEDDILPHLNGRQVSHPDQVTLFSKTIVFYWVKDAEASVCE